MMNPMIPFRLSSLVATRFTFLGIIGLIALLEQYIIKVYAPFHAFQGRFSHSLRCYSKFSLLIFLYYYYKAFYSLISRPKNDTVVN